MASGEAAPPKPYWEGLYWDGFSPEAVGAVPLDAAGCDDDPAAEAMLRRVRHEVAGAGTAPEEYFVTLVDVEAAGKTVVRLWHRDVFAGARDSAVTDPGAKNADYHFDARTGEPLGGRRTWEETEAECEALVPAHAGGEAEGNGAAPAPAPAQAEEAPLPQ